MKTSNRPQSGSVLRKEPIRDPEALTAIKMLLKNKLRDLALFTMAINTNLRMCDILALNIESVRNLRVGDELMLREKKTGKIRRIVINRAVWQSLQDWLNIHPRAEDDGAPLFLSRKGGALRVATLNNMIKGWCRDVGLKGSFGCHTTRKTFGYQHRVTHKTDLPTLQLMYGHSHQRQTLAYLCIQPDEIVSAYMKEI